MRPCPTASAFEPGLGGLTKIVVTTPAAAAEVYLHGAHVTHYQPAGQPPVLFLSRQSKFEPGKAIRGGVPICFPWFGPLESHPKAPAHGFARTAPWTLAAATRDGDAVTVRLTLARGDVPRPTGRTRSGPSTPSPSGRELTTALTVHHAGGEPFLYEAALHTYLHVGDVRRVTVHRPGEHAVPRQGARRRAAVASTARSGSTARPTGSTSTRPPPVTADDPALGRRLTVEKAGSDSTVVWNPWVAKAAALPTSATTSGRRWSAWRRPTSAAGP